VEGRDPVRIPSFGYSMRRGWLLRSRAADVGVHIEARRVTAGHRLRPPAGTRDRTAWNEFLVVRNRRWHVGDLVVMGDAAHTAHFTIGSGTRLAMEDAMTLSTTLATEPTQRGPWRRTSEPGSANFRRYSARLGAAPK
jgi:2-polyprenyl-6-methoxyphenol hydroxylase-like FAD-dependent oxidoreductase